MVYAMFAILPLPLPALHWQAAGEPPAAYTTQMKGLELKVLPRVGASDISRFSPRIDRIFFGVALNPFFVCSR